MKTKVITLLLKRLEGEMALLSGEQKREMVGVLENLNQKRLMNKL